MIALGKGETRSEASGRSQATKGLVQFADMEAITMCEKILEQLKKKLYYSILMITEK